MVSISHSRISGRVVVPSSKSVAHRMLLAAALSDKATLLSGSFEGDDIRATIECLTALGGKFDIGDNITVHPLSNSITKRVVVDVGASGSTLRFLLPVVCALGIETEFCGTERLMKRPIDGLIESMCAHGAIVSKGQSLVVSGRLTSGDYTIDATISSQYITGLLFALACLGGDSRLLTVGNSVSSAYIDITLSVLKQFGVQVDVEENGYLVRGGKRIISPATIDVEGDWSSAAFFAVGGALSGDVVIGNLSLESKQGDKIIVELMKNCGIDVEYAKGELHVRKSTPHSFVYNAEDCPDTVPVMAVLAACAQGVSVINGIHRLRFKESDRIAEVLRLLNSFGITATADDNQMRIVGGELQAANITLPDDHRLAMSAAIAACVAKGKSELCGMECISKSYPHFLDDLIKLGGECSVQCI